MSQRTQIKKIYQNQNQRNKALDELRERLILQMYRSLTDGKSYRERVKKLVQIQLNKKEPVDKKAVEFALKTYQKFEKRKQAEIPTFGLITGSILFAYLIDHNHIEERIHTIIYENERQRIGEEKEAFIMSDLTKNRLEHKIFYLCSRHDDCAEDHRPYQGKIYVDENWEQYADDKESVRKYINEHDIKTYQWVIGKPVWMITRPHCRHYMMPLKESEVLHNSKRKLIKEYDMTRKIGDRADMQTQSSRGREIEQMVKLYENRLHRHIEMNKIAPNKFIQAAINKDTLLLKKWHILFQN